MRETRLLSAEEFESYFAAPMQNVTANADPQIDIWPYVDSIDLDALGLPSINDVHYVYRDAHDRFDQVLIGTGRFNTLLAVVVDRRQCSIAGHHLLDLNERFGARGVHLRTVS
ncbi:MAG: hypothetical protein J0I47_03630 [Sphingomonas sp.]|uniref:hypothetical protein n=1 Tax=Sphingomonas sp. TaxID=28214 RepID=UPI001AC588A1|nr:hypothetical protein [Sphingomonas sp.]MBN8807316.1 hypothetical protein [Sphingomonas sp.]